MFFVGASVVLPQLHSLAYSSAAFWTGPGYAGENTWGLCNYVSNKLLLYFPRQGIQGYASQLQESGLLFQFCSFA